MSGENFQRRATVKKTAPESIEHQVRFEPHRFNSLVFDKGYDVWIDKAYRCPCAVKSTGQALPSCNNCLGIGWVFTNRTETRVAIQGIKADVKYENWTKTTSGTARITARAIDKLAFMDRIILKDVEGYYNEILRTVKKGNNTIVITEYPIIEIEEIFLFENDKTKLTRLKVNEDFTIIDESKLQFVENFTSERTLSIRYRHYMTYHIIDMNRDITKVRQKGCVMSNEELSEMPINGLIRKAHYLFDNTKYEQEERLIRNDN